MSLLLVMLATLFGGRTETEPVCPDARHGVESAAIDSVLAHLHAEEIVLTGMVCDDATGKPIPGATVRLGDGVYATATNADGRYLLRGPPRLPSEAMLRVDTDDRTYYSVAHEIGVRAPWDGTVVVLDGRTIANPGFAVRFDVRLQRRPGVF